MSQMPSQKQRVWDLPLRLFHWILVTAIAVSLYTGLTGGFKEMDYHMLSGYTVLGLIIFRVLWGFVGSKHSRFMNFITIRQLWPYARQLFKRDGQAATGHNPLGALSIVAMVIVLLIQAGTGLFANDDIMLEGPLTHLVSDDTSDLLTTIHHLNLWALYFLLGLHLTAIVFYELYKGQRLITAMITGKKKGEANDHPQPVREVVLGLIVAAISAGTVYWIVTQL